MKMLLLISTIVCSSVVWAADAPETITIPNKKGTITLQHKAHADRIKDCSKCHATAAGGDKFLPMGMMKGHTTCKACHQANGGPTNCGDCHK